MAKFLIRRLKQLTKSTFKVEPDPAHPFGGYARILKIGGFAQHEVHVEVLNQYSKEHLGESGWQPTKHRFGPYRVDTEKQGIVVGPEIVGHLQANSLYKLTIERFSEQLHWPNSINPPPVKLGVGGISRPDPPEPPDGGSGPFPEGNEKDPTPAPVPEPIVRKSSLATIVLALALIAAAFALFFFLTDREPAEEDLETPPAGTSEQLDPEPVSEPEEPEETEPAPEPEPIESEPVTEPEEHEETEPASEPAPEPEADEPAPDPCGSLVLLDQSVPFEQRLAAVKGCPAGTEDDVILELLREGVELKMSKRSLFAVTYTMETEMIRYLRACLVFQMAITLCRRRGYYDRGADTGDPKAKELEYLTCRRLLGKTDEASQWAVTVYCED